MDNINEVLYRPALGLLIYLVIYYLIEKGILTLALMQRIAIGTVALCGVAFVIVIFIRLLKLK